MTAIFLTLLQMSVTASWVAIAVLLVRPLLKRAPAVFSYALWGAVLIRLLVPGSFAAAFSFLRALGPAGKQLGVAVLTPGAAGSGSAEATSAVAWPIPAAASPSSWMMAATLLWATGTAIMLIRGIVTYIRVGRLISTATRLEDGGYETDLIRTPFVYGLLRPRIYVPTGLAQPELDYILAHERSHIRRADHLIQPIAYAALALHWFNPLMWLSFRLMRKDMEMSCDERVLSKLGSAAKGGYARTLLALSTERGRSLMSSPLSFGKSHIHARIRRVLRYRKPSPWRAWIAGLVTLIFIVGFSANPVVPHADASLDTQGLAATWAEALATRDGESRYTMMSASMQARFVQEQIVRSGTDWNFVIGDSSPWVTGYEVTVNGEEARIVYATRTSVPASYETVEVIRFGTEDGRTVVTDYWTEVENRPMD